MFFIVFRTLIKWCSQTGFPSGKEKDRSSPMRSVDIGLTLLTCTSAIAILLCILCSRLPFKQRTMHGDASTRRTPSKTGIYILPLIFAIIYQPRSQGFSLEGRRGGKRSFSEIFSGNVSMFRDAK